MALPDINVAIKDENIYLNLEDYHDDIIDYIKTINGSRYKSKFMGYNDVWQIPAEPEAVNKLSLLNVNLKVKKSDLKQWEKIKNQAEEEKDNEKLTKDIDVSDYPFIYEPWDHQRKALKMSRKLNNVGLLFDMGSGKTKAAIDITGYRFKENEISSSLILCPLSIKQVWFKELKEHMPYDYDIIDLHCDNNKQKREQNMKKVKRYNKMDDILTFGITTFDSAWRMTDKIIDCGFESGIADESTDIKNHSAKRSKGAHKIAKSEPMDYRLILTGTAITNSPLDAWSQYEFLDPSVFDCNYFQFENYYAQKGGWKGKEIVGYQNMNDLKQKIHSISLRVTKDECLDLPEKTFTERYVQLSEEEMNAYEDLKKESILYLNEKDNVTVNNILAELAKLQQLANGFIHFDEIDYVEDEINRKTEVIGHSKLNELKRIIKNIDDKIVIWVKFRQDIDQIEEMLNDEFDFDFVSLHGGTSNKSGELEKQFHNDEDTKVFISQIQTGAKGIDLTAAHTSVYYSNTFSLDNYLQSQDRLHREGQDNKVTYVRLISEDTIDERIIESLEENEKLAKEIMDDVKKGGLSDL